MHPASLTVADAGGQPGADPGTQVIGVQSRQDPADGGLARQHRAGRDSQGVRGRAAVGRVDYFVQALLVEGLTLRTMIDSKPDRDDGRGVVDGLCSTGALDGLLERIEAGEAGSQGLMGWGRLC